MHAGRPSCHDDFEIAIICALALEFDTVRCIFDELWVNDDQYRPLNGDSHIYTHGRIGKHNVVLARSGLGKANSADAAVSLRSSYRGIRLVLVVGVCSAAPFNKRNPVMLGDIIISDQMMQYDLTCQYPNESTPKTTAKDLGIDAQNLVGIFETNLYRSLLETQTLQILQDLQVKHQGKYDCPGIAQDKLFEQTYRHKHHGTPSCICRDCFQDADPVCEEALGLSCEEVGCSEERLVSRNLTGQSLASATRQPFAHVGVVASGDAVIKSATDRERLSKEHGAIGFEMQGAGVWGNFPNVILLKSACDYADGHENRAWQNYAAAIAASSAKAILEYYIGTDGLDSNKKQNRPKPFSMLIPRDTDFVDRPDIMKWMRDHAESAPRMALVGLGGVGKSQLAIEYAYQVWEQPSSTWIFWVHAGTRDQFLESYTTIANRLQLPSRSDRDTDILKLVSDWLCVEENGRWLMILDNADDATIFSPQTSEPLIQFIPNTNNGTILVTSRSLEAAESLVGSPMSCREVPAMATEEACQLLKAKLGERYEAPTAEELVNALDFVPLAISQAAALIYRQTPRMSVPTYLERFQQSAEDKATLLKHASPDLRRDWFASNSLLTTWNVTFEQIRIERPSAADLLVFMSFFPHNKIPDFMLRAYAKLEGGTMSESISESISDHTQRNRKHTLAKKLQSLLQQRSIPASDHVLTSSPAQSSQIDSEKSIASDLDEDIEMLRGYFLVKATNETEFEMSSLVQFCTQNWLSSFDDDLRWQTKFLRVMEAEHSSGELETWTPISKPYSIGNRVRSMILGD